MKAIMLSAALLAAAPAIYATSASNYTTVAETEETIDVTVETAGSLGVEILYKVDVLSDVVSIRISGPLDDTDWTTISNLTNAESIDMRDARTATVPAKAFNKCSKLHECLLPATLTTIGNEAFKKTQLTEIEIPASVTSIGESAFSEVGTLTKVTFEDNSQLTSLGNWIFYACASLENIILPDNVATIPQYAFYYCENLKDAKLPKNLQRIAYEAFYYTPSLQNIDFPASLKAIESYAFQTSGLQSIILPSNLAELGSYSFSNCKNVTEIQLPSYLNDDNLYRTFSDCSSITKVVCPQICPASGTNRPFGYIDLSKITLIVPDVSVALYKLSPFWLEFGDIQGGASVDKCIIDANFVLSGDRRFDGNPALEIEDTGYFLISGQAPQKFSSMTLFNNLTTGKYAQLISNCSQLSADAVIVSSYVYSDRWYFISPVVDTKITDISHADANASFIFRHYDGEKRAADGSGGWSDLTDDILYAGQGYIFHTNRSGYITYKAYDADAIAKMTAGADVVTPVYEYPSESDAHAGWNYISNPFASNFDANYIDYTAPITVWDQNRNTYKAISLIDDSYVLSPMEAFFVQCPAGISNVTFLKEGRQTGSTPAVHAPATAKASERRICNITISGNNSSDATRIVMNPDSKTDYEISIDATKFMSHDLTVPQISSIDNHGNLLAINERPEADGRVNLSVYFPAPGTYTIEVDNEEFTIVDNQKNTAAASHTVTVDSEGTDDNRFYVTLPTQTGVAALSSARTWTISANEGTVSIKSGDKDVEITIVAIDGRTVCQTAVKANTNATIDLDHGTYVATANGKAVKFIVK